MTRGMQISDWTLLNSVANLLVLRSTIDVRISAIIRAECSTLLLLRLHHYSVCLHPKKSVWGRGGCSSPLKVNWNIICRAHAFPLPCRVAKGLDCVFPVWFTQRGRVSFTHNMPCPCRAPAVLRPRRSESDFSRSRHSTTGTRHGHAWYVWISL